MSAKGHYSLIIVVSFVLHINYSVAFLNFTQNCCSSSLKTFPVIIGVTVWFKSFLRYALVWKCRSSYCPREKDGEAACSCKCLILLTGLSISLFSLLRWHKENSKSLLVFCWSVAHGFHHVCYFVKATLATAAMIKWFHWFHSLLHT